MTALAKVQDQKPDYTYWMNALTGTFGPVHDDDPQPGFYRKRTRKAAGYVPVAIWEQDGKLIAAIDGHAGDANAVWTYCCTNPIREEHYHARVKTGKWHDEDDAVTESLAHRTDTNNPPTDEAEILQGQIDAAAAGAEQYAEIADDETAAKAQSLRSRLLELSGNADRMREDKKRPHLEAGKAIDAKYMPLVKLAKAAADAIRTALGQHETRKARAAEQARRLEEEARVKAAREAAPLDGLEELIGPTAPVPAPLPEPAPAIRGAYGRAAAVKVVKIAKVTDQDAAYLALKSQPELAALIQKLAQKMVDAGYSLAGVEITEERKVS